MEFRKMVTIALYAREGKEYTSVNDFAVVFIYLFIFAVVFKLN